MVNVKNLDLNLIRIFDALMEDRSIRRAALRLGLTQSAISHALNRLRYHLNDGVFVRTRDGMVPTARAIQISGPLREAMRLKSHSAAPSLIRSNRSGALFWRRTI
jgi:DNA-binding transcriptional LysR family regulator